MRYQSTNADQTREAVLLQSDLSQIGVTLTLTPITFADYLKLLSDNSTIPQMMLLADSAQLPTAGAFMTQFFGAASKGSNRAGFYDPQVISLLNQAAATSDATQQCTDYQQAEKIIQTNAVAIDLLNLGWPVAYTSNVSGVTLSRTVTPLSISTLRVA